MLLTTRFLNVAKFTILTPFALSLLSWSNSYWSSENQRQLRKQSLHGIKF